MRIAIVGAGIIGLYLALKLSEKGHKVTVFEKKEKIGKEACSGLFSERILKFIPESQKLVQNQIDSVLIHFPRKTFTVKFKRKFFVISHAQLDRQVSDLARKAGVEIILNSQVKSLPDGFNRIIGCDGYSSFIRNNLGLKSPIFRATIQGFIPVKEDKSSFPPSSRKRDSVVETWPVGAGFIWKIPRSKEVEEDKSSSSPKRAFEESEARKENEVFFEQARVVEYGIIGKPGEVKKLFEDFLNKNNLKLERLIFAVVPQGFIVPKNPLVALCGDATGLTKPWSGGGVIWGLMAAEILLKNFPDFLKYKNRLKRIFLPRIIISKIGTRMVYFLGFNFPWLLPKNIKIEGDFLF